MKKMLAMALALLMVAVLLPVTAMAEGTALPEAVDGKITLTDNVTLASPHNITTDTVLDLGGKTLAGSLNIRNGANVTIKNGKMAGSQVINVYGTTNGNKTTLTIENDVEITATGGYGVCIFGVEYTSPTGASVVNLNGCKITAMAGVFVSGNLQNEDGAVLNINGATIISKPEIAVVVNGKVTVDVNNAFLEGDTALYIKAGTVNINNSTVKGSGDAKDPKPNGSGADATGDAIVMDSYDGYAGNMVLTLGAGSTITSTNGYALQVAETSSATTAVTKLEITGGTLKGSTDAVKLSEKFVDAANAEGSNVTASVTGGTFNGNTTVLKNYLADGLTINSNGTVENTPIVIIGAGDTTDTTTTTEKPANPATGANDFVGAAAALAAVSLLGMAAITRKK